MGRPHINLLLLSALPACIMLWGCSFGNNCDSEIKNVLCYAGLSLFRAAGVPVAIDYVPLWGYGNRGHVWAVVLGPNGKNIPFVPLYVSPHSQHKINETISKVYRRTYARNHEIENLNISEPYVPDPFRDIFQFDVTAEYTNVRDLELEIPGVKNKYVYLCGSSRAKWKPIAFAKAMDGKVKFRDIGNGCVYLMATYDNMGIPKYVTNPFIINRDGCYKSIEPDTTNLQKVLLYRKAPLLEYAWLMAVRIENGLFEASNSRDFATYETVGRVAEGADHAGEISVPKTIGAFRYWRYRQIGNPAYCYIGDVNFIKDDKLINEYGKAYSSVPGVKAESNPSVAFDGDVLTSYSASQPGESWVALDFGEPIKPDLIRYTPRSDGNMIEPGDEYELSYWYGGVWKPISRKTATTTYVEFDDVPRGALLILNNVTKGNSVRIFMIDNNGCQQWW